MGADLPWLVADEGSGPEGIQFRAAHKLHDLAILDDLPAARKIQPVNDLTHARGRTFR
ncbi:hypothetical protein ACEUZ9_000931 [Paracoccus litorisediminis]|uniref:hypothetical protein n=1 Tax=Paracoccus litorisediminis TaxID=2006130 RepID=UPI003731F55E